MTTNVIKINRVGCGAECISCTACVRIAPGIFRLNAETNLAEVITDDFCGYEAQILRARHTCPVCNIAVDVEGDSSEVVFRVVPVDSVKSLTKDVIELKLKLPTLSFSPGQYISLKMHDADGDFFRAYSVVDYENGCIRLCIKLEEYGRAAAIFSKVEVGTKFYISEAKGIFSISENGLKSAESIMVATGTGVAPILAMAKATSSPTTILLGFRSEADIIYFEELQRLPTTKVKVVLSQPSESWQGLRGRVTDHLEPLSLAVDSQIYICGHEAMIEAVSTKLEALGFDREKIIAEAYDHAPPVAHKVPLWQVPVSKWSSTK